MSERVQCKSCGASILVDTAARTGGLCAPCRGGYRQRIEAGKREREREQEYERSAERKYWLALVARINAPGGGFDQLAPHEKTYFAVSSLIGEVYNGGFDQFFFNSSGALYAYALDGLFEIGAERSASLLGQAKDILFGNDPIPLDTDDRRRRAREVTQDSRLEALDKAFWADPDELAKRRKAYAVTHALYEGEGD
jgi:hypothetical protein